MLIKFSYSRLKNKTGIITNRIELGMRSMGMYSAIFHTKYEIQM